MATFIGAKRKAVVTKEQTRQTKSFTLMNSPSFNADVAGLDRYPKWLIQKDHSIMSDDEKKSWLAAVKKFRTSSMGFPKNKKGWDFKLFCRWCRLFLFLWASLVVSAETQFDSCQLVVEIEQQT